MLVSLNKGMAAMLGSQLNPRELNSILMQIISFILIEKYAHWSREWKHFKFSFLNMDHVMVSGEFYFVFAELMLTSARAENESAKKLFPGVSSRGLYWENKMYKLKRSIALLSLQTLAIGWKFETRNFAVIFVFIPFTTHEKTSFTELASQSLTNGFSGPKILRTFEKRAPGQMRFYCIPYDVQ